MTTMILRRMTGLALGLALPLTFVVSAAADDESFRDRLVGSVPTYAEADAAVAGTTIVGTGFVIAAPTGDDFAGLGDAARAEFSTLYSDVRTAILEGPSDD
ncbi:MAG: hypothetical protein M3464_13135 [Chloroflexota bacterium]|nr:hypothetical protein [Chloroflexota bacterium]